MSGVPGSRIIDAIALLVPADCREDWRAEWQAELAAQPASRALAMRVRSLGAITDALWHRRHCQEPFAMSQNLKYALRLMRRRPGFSLVVILTLALGIGGTTAIYSVVNAVLIRSLPYPDPDRLFTVRGVPTDGNAEKVNSWGSYLDYRDYRQQIHGFSELAAYRQPGATLTMPGSAAHFVETALTTANIFKLLGVTPQLGRTYTSEEESPGAPRVAVVAHDFWRNRFASDPAVLGKIVQIDGQPYTIIGVLPEGFRFGGADFWLPLVPGQLEATRGAHTLQIFGRIRDGVSRDEVEREARAVAADLEARYPGENAKRSVRLEGLQAAAVADSRAFLLALMGGVALVLLIVCTNIANLFLVRATAREQEIAVRTALGASRGTLFHQFLTESLLLTLLGALLGLPLAWWGVRALVASAPQALPRLNSISVDPVALGFMLAIALLAGLLFGIVPSAHALGRSVGQGIRERSPGPRHGRLSRGFVVTQIALAGVLVIGASLLAKSLWRLHQVDLRFNPEHLLVAHIQLPRSRYGEPAQALAFFDRVRRRLGAEPGVLSVSTAFEHPLSEGWTSSFVIAELPPPKAGEEPEARVRPVAPGYFHAMGETMIQGRDLDAQADFAHPGEVVVNQAFARRFFPTGSAIGKHLHRGSWWPGQPGTFEIVGVVADERFRGLAEEADAATYFPHQQFPMNEMYLLVRTGGDPAPLREELRRDVWSIDRDLALESIPTMDDLVSAQTAAPRFNMRLIGLFAVAALLLAAIGVYGVLAQMVTQRTREIGIRLALGADRAVVLRLVVGQGLRLSLVGAAAGLCLALGVTRILDSQLYAVQSRDPIIFAAVGTALIATAIVAAYLPARRASRLDPVVALKAE
jgi:putative ABC transport system permease protein